MNDECKYRTSCFSLEWKKMLGLNHFMQAYPIPLIMVTITYHHPLTSCLRPSPNFSTAGPNDLSEQGSGQIDLRKQQVNDNT